ncbi:MAG: hypothetical protein HYX39_13420 [Bacteroidetes bacterium]|nr:hypothetical protein [Bacteroidota bacterium]
MLFNYGFFKVYVECQKTNFRQELISIGSKNMEEIEINTADLYKNKKGVEWHENNKEIAINEVFFEVIKVVSQNNKTILYVIKDEKENNLFASYFNSKQLQNNFLVQLVKIMCGLHLINTCNFEFKWFKKNNGLLNNVGYLNFGIDFNLQLLKPPQTFSF